MNDNPHEAEVAVGHEHIWQHCPCGAFCDCGERAEADLPAIEWEALEGAVSVYDHEGRYLGFMGTKAWEAQLAAQPPPVSQSVEEARRAIEAARAWCKAELRCISTPFDIQEAWNEANTARAAAYVACMRAIEDYDRAAAFERAVTEAAKGKA